jgi:hypothetical protein
VNVETGEYLPATVANAATVLLAARSMKHRIDDVIAGVTTFLVGESAVRGTKTLNTGDRTVTLTGGEGISYDAVDLMEALRMAGCPEDRIEQAVTTTVSYKVNRSVLTQLRAANPDYKAAIELAERQVEMPWRASVK